MAKASNQKNTTGKTAPVATKQTAPVKGKVVAPVVTETTPVEPVVENNAKPLEANASKELVEKMLPYQEAYPNNKIFYITSDGQVFLESNKVEAELHEKTLGGTLEPFANQG